MTATTQDATRATADDTRGLLRTAWFPTALLLVGAIYTLFPVSWVAIASTKSGGELFSTFTLAPGTGFVDNVRDLNAYRSGVYWRWLVNSAIYAGLGALLSTVVSASCGYALAKFRFPGRRALFSLILAGVLVPAIILAVPQYLLLADIGLANTYWSVLLPSILSPFGIYLARIYAGAAVATEMIEAARIDQANELSIFVRIAMPVMVPGLVTIFLFQFVAIWNNYLLPLVMLNNTERFPVTLGLTLWNSQIQRDPFYYQLVVTGSAVSAVLLVAVMVSLQRFWRAGLTAGATKG